MNSEKIKIEEAFKQIVAQEKKRKFVEKVELQIKLNKKYLTNLKFKKSVGYIDLPHSTKIDASKIATIPKKADFVSFEEIMANFEAKQLKKKIRNFKWLVVEKTMIKALRGFEKTIATAGLMPDEKDSSLTQEHDLVLKQILNGRRKIRIHSDGVTNICIGNIKLTANQIKENAKKVCLALIELMNCPKELAFEKVYLHPTMNKSYQIDHKDLIS